MQITPYLGRGGLVTYDAHTSWGHSFACLPWVVGDLIPALLIVWAHGGLIYIRHTLYLSRFYR